MCTLRQQCIPLLIRETSLSPETTTETQFQRGSRTATQLQIIPELCSKDSGCFVPAPQEVTCSYIKNVLTNVFLARRNFKTDNVESMALLLLKILRQVYNENEQVEQKKKCSEEKTLGSLMGQKERFVWKRDCNCQRASRG